MCHLFLLYRIGTTRFFEAEICTWIRNVLSIKLPTWNEKVSSQREFFFFFFLNSRTEDEEILATHLMVAFSFIFFNGSCRF